jgi:hypothetical protein
MLLNNVTYVLNLIAETISKFKVHTGTSATQNSMYHTNIHIYFGNHDSKPYEMLLRNIKIVVSVNVLCNIK